MELTIDQIWAAGKVMIVILAGLFGGLVTIDKVAEIFKRWKAPQKDAAQDVEKKFSNDKQRLDEHQQELERQKKDIESLKESSRVTSAGVMALLDHELHNGNTDQMQDARDDIMEYLQGLMTK